MFKNSLSKGKKSKANKIGDLKSGMTWHGEHLLYKIIDNYL